MVQNLQTVPPLPLAVEAAQSQEVGGVEGCDRLSALCRLNYILNKRFNVKLKHYLQPRIAVSCTVIGNSFYH